MPSKKRILLVGDSILRSTGYSRVASSIIHYLKDKYDLAQLGVADIPSKPELKLPIEYYTVLKDHTKCCGKGQIIEHKIKDTGKFEYIVPTISTPLHPNQNFCQGGHNNTNDLFGQDSSFFVIQHFRPDIVIPINDIWGLYHYNYLMNRKHFFFMPYLAVDSECFPLEIEPQRAHMPKIETIKFLGGSSKVVVFTEWARDTINKTVSIATDGKTAKNIEIIPHGVDNNIFRPLDNKEELRERYFKIKPEDSVFLTGTIARNQPRKGLDRIMQMLRIFIDKYEKPNKKIMFHFHCAMKDRMGWDLVWLARYYSVLDRCIFDNKLMPGFGVPEPILNEIMNTYDAHLLMANSEGWCTFGETRILTDKGITRLDNIKVNDKVITHTGKVRRVKQPLSRQYKGNMIGIKYTGATDPVWFTPNHNILVKRNNHNTWIRCDKLKTSDYLCLPIPKFKKENTTKIDVSKLIKKYPITIEDNKVYALRSYKCKNNTAIYKNKKSKPVDNIWNITPQLATLFGWYIAEGSTGHGDIKFSINASSDNIIREGVTKFSNDMSLHCKSHIMDRNRENISIYSTTLAHIFKSFGSGAHNKSIPSEIFKLIKGNTRLTESILNGLIEGDGSFLNNNSVKNAVTFTTVSETLAFQVKTLLYSLGIFARLYHHKVRNSFDVWIQGAKSINYMSKFIDKIPDNLNITIHSRNIQTKQDNNYFYPKIKNLLNQDYDGTVYNISVEEDQSYVTEGFAVHNCLPILETMGAGIPNVVTDYSAHGCWTTGHALKIKILAKIHEVRTNHIKAVPDADHAAKQLSLLYNSDKMCREYSRLSLTLADELQWSNVCDKWIETIDSIDIDNLEEDRYSVDLLKLEDIPIFPEQPVQTSFTLAEF